MQKNFKCIVIHKKMTELLQIIGGLEQDKVVAEPGEMIMEGPDGSLLDVDKMFTELTTSENAPPFAFFYLDDEHVFWDKEIRGISNGTGWSPMKDVIIDICPDLTVETDENMYITSIKKT